MSYIFQTALQINIYPLDMPHVRWTLPHQIRTLGDQVDTICITLDNRRSRSGRYRGAKYDESLAEIREFLALAQVSNAKLSIVEVDYSQGAAKKVADTFFSGEDVPHKAWDGGPFYAYFFGLHAAQARYVFHIDGDMLFGGGCRVWIDEAIKLLGSQKDVLFMAPLAGPPHPDVISQKHKLLTGAPAEQVGHFSPALRFDHVSTRVFFVDLKRFAERVGALDIIRPSVLKRLKSRILGNPPLCLEAEHILSKAMIRHGLSRIDVLGSTPGLWSLHPPFRSPEFCRALPDLISRIERGDVPHGQLGDYNINDSFFDWSSVRALNTWPHRMRRHLVHFAERVWE